MRNLKIFILLGVILICGAASAVIFQDHGGDSPINYINIDGIPSSNSIACLERNKVHKCVMGFAPEYGVAGYEFKMYIIISGIPVPLPVSEETNRQRLPWYRDQNIDLHFVLDLGLNVVKDLPQGKYPIKVEVIDIKGRSVVCGSFMVEI